MQPARTDCALASRMDGTSTARKEDSHRCSAGARARAGALARAGARRAGAHSEAWCAGARVGTERGRDSKAGRP